MSRRIRIRFRKEGDLRHISHRDLLRTMERLFRRVGLKLSMSQGYHPKPKMTFPLALALGVAGAEEVVELEVDEEPDAELLASRLQEQAPPGLGINSVQVLPPGARKGRVCAVTLEMPIPPDRHEKLQAAIDHLWSQPSCILQRDRGKRPVDVREHLESIQLQDGRLTIQLQITPSGGVRPDELTAVLGIADLAESGAFFTRSQVKLEPPVEAPSCEVAVDPGGAAQDEATT